MFTRSMMRPSKKERQKEIEREKERGGKQRRERLKRGVRRLWQSVKWCARD